MPSGIRPLAGDTEPVPSTKYVCPLGDYVWFRSFVGRPIPPCPTHHVALVAEWVQGMKPAVGVEDDAENEAAAEDN